MEIKTREINKKQIIATVDEEDNSVDIAVLIDGNPDVTFNITVDAKKDYDLDILVSDEN